MEPLNAPAFFEYIKNLEKMRLISDIDWEKYQKELLHERVLFYRALHGNIADATIRIGVSKAYLLSQTHNRWRTHELPGELFEKVGSDDNDSKCAAVFEIYESNRAMLLDLLMRRSRTSMRDIRFNDPEILNELQSRSGRNASDEADYASVPWLGLWGMTGEERGKAAKVFKDHGTLQNFDDLVNVTRLCLCRSGQGCQAYKRIAESIYEALIAVAYAWFYLRDKKLFLECYEDSVGGIGS